MPRVHFVKKARKDNPAAKRGEPYYWWKFRYGGKRYSKKAPRSSQLTQSTYYSTVRSLCEQIEDSQPDDSDAVIGLRDEIVSELENLRDETQSSLDNMPDSLQYSPTGELLQERVDAIENAISEIENIDEYEDAPDESDFELDKEECPDCEGRGYEDPEDPEEECLNCSGDGEVESTESSEYQEAHAEWVEGIEEYISNAVGNMQDAVSNCEV